MARYVVYLLACLFLVQGYNAAVRRSTESGSSQNQIDEALSSAREAFSNFTSGLGLDNIDSDAIKEQFQNFTQGIASGLSDFVSQIQSEIQSHSGDINTVLQTANERINQTITDLQAQHPDATARVNEVKSQVDTGLQTLLQEATNIARAFETQTSGVRQEVKDLTRNLLDQAAESVRNFQERVRTTVQDHQAKHTN